MNNSGPRYKRSKVERDLNVDVVACVIILFILCFLGGVGKCHIHIISLSVICMVYHNIYCKMFTTVNATLSIMHLSMLSRWGGGGGEVQ